VRSRRCGAQRQAIGDRLDEASDLQGALAIILRAAAVRILHLFAGRSGEVPDQLYVAVQLQAPDL